jgi:hypothetical protein
MKLSEAAVIKVDFEGADFWLIRTHDVAHVGQPVRIYMKDYIGIKVVRTDIIVPDYLYYVFMHLHNSGVFKPNAYGTTKRVHIRVEDIKNIPLAFR